MSKQKCGTNINLVIVELSGYVLNKMYFKFIRVSGALRTFLKMFLASFTFEGEFSIAWLRLSSLFILR